MTKLRFAPIIRVSTEKQKKKGESLNTQTEQIKGYVQYHEGEVPENCSKYKGQEHATPHQERKKLDQLLKDAELGFFDAVIVCDISRWSRDNSKSGEGLRILRNNGIRFFVGPMEYDLFNPDHRYMLTHGVAMAQYFAEIQAWKSITNKIARAKRGIPACGKKPHARIWNKKTEKWEIDHEKHLIIKQAAERYLKGELMADIAKSYNMFIPVLWKILRHRSGDTWPIRFQSKEFNIDETVVLKIPPLLDEETIKAIAERAEANRTFAHGSIKNEYLLSRMIFCKDCDFTLHGATSPRNNKHRYYKHKHRKSYKNICPMNRGIPAGKIEEAVLLLLARTLGDRSRMKKAIAQATPDIEKVTAMRDERTQLERSLFKLGKQREAVVNAIAIEILTQEEAKKKMDNIRESIEKANQRVAVINDQLHSLPDLGKLEKLKFSFRGKVWANASKQDPSWILDKPYDFKRSLVQEVFGGKDAQGRRYGVYAKKDSTTGQIIFELYGLVVSEELTLPLSQERIEDGPGEYSGYQRNEAIERRKEEETTSLALSRQ